MMLRVNGQYLDFNGDIEIEKKIKLFEDIETTDGDVSFAFDIELTSNNIRILNKPFPDSSSKTVYTIQDTEALNDEGMLINRGYIRIERITGRIASCSFWGGNNNWFALLSGSLRDITGTSVEVTQSNIVTSWSNTSGIVFPFCNTGILSDRKQERMLVDDFHPFLYIHTLVKEIFKRYSIKLEGELLSDWLFKNTVLTTSLNQQDQINEFKVFANKTASTAVTDSGEIIPFESVADPYFGNQYYDSTTGIFTAPFAMVVKAKATIEFSDPTDLYQIAIYINNQPVPGKLVYSAIGDTSLSIDLNVLLQSGNNLTIVAEVRNVGGTANAIAGTLELTPVYIYNIDSYSELLPDLSEKQFINYVFQLFNVIPVYDNINKTLTVNLFDKIKEKTQIDISEYIEVNEVDYSEFVSSYAKKNKFLWNSEIEGFGSGEINCSNNYLEEETEVIDSDFVVNQPTKSTSFKCQVENYDLRQDFEYISTNITSVSNSGGIARFNVDSTALMSVGNLIRIETEAETYSGDYLLTTVGVGYFEIDTVSYVSNDTGTAKRMLQVPTENNDLYIAINCVNQSISSFSDISEFYIISTAYQSIAYLYFNLYNEGKTITDTYKQSLFFGPDDNENFVQQTIISKYWKEFERILNDAVMLKVTANLPLTIYNRLDFLHPVTIRTKESSNLYYVNRISGYKNSYTPCEIELIKLP